MQDHLAVAGRREADAAFEQFAAQLRRVDQVAVVGDRQRPVQRLDHIWLGVAQPGRTGGRVARVADGQVALQIAQVLFVEHLRDQPHALVHVGHAAVAGDNARRLLPPVLQGIERKKGMARHIAAGA